MFTKIKTLFPQKLITHHLADLNRIESEFTVDNLSLTISFENNTRSRQFCHIIFEDLCMIFQRTRALERYLYEVISPFKPVKIYVDYEYLVMHNLDIQDHFIGPRCLLKVLYWLLSDRVRSEYYSEKEHMDLILNEYLVLTA